MTFTGLVSGDEKLEALRDADVFVLPSRFEALSVSMLEALANGLPVLISDRIAGHTQIAANQAGIVVPVETQAIALGLVRLANPTVQQSMRGRGVSLVGNAYTWDVIARDLMREIEKEVGPKAIAEPGGAHKSDVSVSRE